MLTRLAISGLLVAAPILTATTHSQTPSIQEIKTSPTVADSDGVVLLPNGSGKLHIQVKAANAQRVRFWLTHMEVGSWEDRQLFKEDTDGSDGWEADFPYDRNEGFSYQIIVEAMGPASQDVKSQKSIYVHHSIGLDESK